MAALKKGFRFLWAIWGMVVFLVSLLIVTPIYLLIFGIAGQKGERAAHRVSQFWARFLFIGFLIRVKVHNKSLLDGRETYIFVANHNSQLDIPALAVATDHIFKFLAKEELTKIPLLGYIIKHLYLTVNRQSPKARAKSMETMKAALENGTSVVVFPEGSRNRTDKPLMRFFDGAFQLGVQSGYPIAVLTIEGSRSLLPPGEMLQLSPGVIHCYWEEVLETTGRYSSAVQELKDLARSRMEERLS